jgi:hypothetical protein
MAIRTVAGISCRLCRRSRAQGYRGLAKKRGLELCVSLVQFDRTRQNYVRDLTETPFPGAILL